MKLKKIISALAAAALLLPCTSCGLISVSRVDDVPLGDGHGTGAEKGEKTGIEAYVPEDAGEISRARAAENIRSLGEYGFAGDTVFAAAPGETGMFPENCAERADRLAVQRNAIVEDTLNVKFVTDEMFADEIRAWTKREDKAGEVVYDLLVIPSSDIAGYAAEKTLADLSKIGSFTADDRFIDAESAKGSSIGDAVYGAAGLASFSPEEYTAVYFSKAMLPADELYSLVKNGSWTWDKLLAYADAADGAVETPQPQQALLDIVFRTSGGSYLTKKSGALPTQGFTADSLKETYSIFVELMNAGVKTSSYSAADDFIAGGAAFVVHKLAAMPKIADSAADFGVLPLPKMNEGGEYISPALREYPMFAVPREAENKEKSAAVILALNAASEGIIRGAYVDCAFREYLRDEESADMLEMILTTAKTDAAYELGGMYPEIAAATYDFVYKYRSADEKTFAKQYTAAQTAMKKALEKAKKAIDKVK